MREIGTMLIPETGSEAIELTFRKAKHTYSVSRSISGYFCLYRDGDLMYDNPLCEDVHDEDKAYYFFAELIKEKEK